MELCKICGKECKNINALGMHIAKSHPEITKQEYYDKYILKDKSKKICPTCGKENKFKNIVKGYSEFCSLSCFNKQPNFKERVKQGVRNKYGVDNVADLPEFSNMVKKGFIKKHGVDHNSKVKSVVEKRALTRKNRSEQHKENTRNKYRETYKSKSTEEMDNILSKRIETNLEKYGVENVFQNEDIKEKIKQSNIEIRGVENPSQSPEIQEKRKQTFIDKYGYENPFFSENIQNDIRKRLLEKTYNNRISNIPDYTPLFSKEEYTGMQENKSDKRYKWKHDVCGHKFEYSVAQIKIPRCPKCFPYTSSKEEQEIYEFILNYISENDIIRNDRQVLNGKELDIYIPSKNIAIEFNGLYWHSEFNSGKDKFYHVNKFNECLKNEIQLIQIFSDEWYNKQKIVKSILLSKMGLIEKKIFARKCAIKEVPSKDANEFLDENHIQGRSNSKYNYGLYFDNKLVSLLTIGKARFNKNYEYEIHRFCNILNTNVIGGFSKLLKYFEKTINPRSLITYADIRYSTGSLYKTANFELSHISDPNYFYTNDFLNRESRNKYQKHKLENLLETFDSEMSEIENMANNGFDRIWDCGNMVFTKCKS